MDKREREWLSSHTKFNLGLTVDEIARLQSENAALKERLEAARGVIAEYANRDMWTDVVAEEYDPEEAPSYWVEAHTPWNNVFECQGDGWELAFSWLKEAS